MEGETTKSGIEPVGHIPWGTHLCLFYQSKEDLIEILAPYLKAGLESNQFCMWVTSDPLGENEAKEAMRKVAPNLDRYLERGQMEIVPHAEWYLKDGVFDMRRVLNAWIDKLEHALANGYDGIRVTGDAGWLEKRDWKSFDEYEEEINNVISEYRMLAICTYPLDKCGASEIIDVVDNHQFALVKREAGWQLIGSSRRKQAEEKLSVVNARLQVLQRVTEAVHSTLDLEKVFKEIADGIVFSMGYTTAIILTWNDDKRGFEIKTLSAGKQLLPQINKILGFPLRRLLVPADSELNAVIGSVMKGKAVATNNLTEMLYPLVSKGTCQTLQKLRRTKNYVLVPLKTGEEVVGALFISSPRENVSEEELTTIQNFASTASQAITNANLYMQTKLVEKTLRESQENLRAYLESAPDGVYINDLKGTFLYGNKKAEEIIGYTREELMGKSFIKLNLLRPRGLAKAGKLLALSAMRKPTGPDELELTRKDGSRIWVEISTTPIKQQGEVVVIGFVRDITQRKQAEEREKRLQQELVLNGRLASIGRMASGMAHEMNNPLTGVIGFAQLLMKKDIPDDVRRDLQMVHSEAQRAAKVVEGLLTFARRRKSVREYIDINEVISGVVELRSYEMRVNNIQVVSRLAPDLPPTVADAAQIQQVFLNIILNAEKEMIKAHGRGRLLIKTEKAGDIIRACFTDDGPGISEENLDKVFDPFFTTREVGDGTGLGLSICHGIVTQHNGRIYARSKPGEGATFVVELPIVSNARKTQNSRKVEEEVWWHNGVKILVVDDEPVVLDFLRCLLTDQGYEVDTADTADIALERIHGGQYNLILLDIKLPVMNGIELYHHIEALDPALADKVMFITGDVMESTTRDFLNKTKVPYITKPFDIERLEEGIKSLLTRGL